MIRGVLIPAADVLQDAILSASAGVEGELNSSGTSTLHIDPHLVPQSLAYFGAQHVSAQSTLISLWRL